MDNISKHQTKLGDFPTLADNSGTSCVCSYCVEVQGLF